MPPLTPRGAKLYCHRVLSLTHLLPPVYAFQIGAIEELPTGEAWLYHYQPPGLIVVKASKAYMDSYSPSPGDYWLWYEEGRGHIGLLPAAVFERLYCPMP